MTALKNTPTVAKSSFSSWMRKKVTISRHLICHYSTSPTFSIKFLRPGGEVIEMGNVLPVADRVLVGIHLEDHWMSFLLVRKREVEIWVEGTLGFSPFRHWAGTETYTSQSYIPQIKQSVVSILLFAAPLQLKSAQEWKPKVWWRPQHNVHVNPYVWALRPSKTCHLFAFAFITKIHSKTLSLD